MSDDRRYLCERCGGTGHQEAGHFDADTGLFDRPAGVCDDCDGEGLLGPVLPPDGGGLTYGQAATGCVFGVVAVALVFLVGLAATVFGGKP